MALYRLTFNRIGRDHNIGVREVEADDADQLAALVAQLARRHLASSGFVVAVDLERGKGLIEGGRFGEFAIEEATPA
jgi:hypothetical protein